MNPISATTWFWRAYRGHSVTFSVLFASALLGFSVLGWFRHVLHAWGAPWYVWLILPVVVVSAMAKNESRWFPDENKRRTWSRWIVIGAVLIIAIVSRFAPKQEHEPAPASARPQRPMGHRQ